MIRWFDIQNAYFFVSIAVMLNDLSQRHNAYGPHYYRYPMIELSLDYHFQPFYTNCADTCRKLIN